LAQLQTPVHKPSDLGLAMFAISRPFSWPQQDIGRFAQACARLADIACEKREVLTLQPAIGRWPDTRRTEGLQSLDLPLQPVVGEYLEAQVCSARRDSPVEDVDPGDLTCTIKRDVFADRTGDPPHPSSVKIEAAGALPGIDDNPGTKNIGIKSRGPDRQDASAILGRILSENEDPIRRASGHRHPPSLLGLARESSWHEQTSRRNQDCGAALPRRVRLGRVVPARQAAG
jgi:hypothetical protein